MSEELKDMSFDKLVDYCAWMVVEGLLKGERLRTLIWQVCDFSARWRGAQG